MILALSGTELDEGEPTDDLVAAACALGIEWVELWHPRNTSAAGPGPTLDRLADAGLRVACVSTGSELYRAGGSTADQALLLDAIALAMRAGAPFVNTYFGYAAARDDDRAIATYRELLGPCLQAATEVGVTIVLENEFNAFGADPSASDVTRRPEILAKLFRAVDSPHFRLNYDPSNFFCAGVEPFTAAYEPLAPFIGYVHVKDCRPIPPEPTNAPVYWKRYTDYERNYATCDLGTGAIPWPTVFARLRADGYRGFLVLEPHSQRRLLPAAWGRAAEYVRAHAIERPD
jgi:sugar phosphate isomerase/epimerase